MHTTICQAWYSVHVLALATILEENNFIFSILQMKKLNLERFVSIPNITS